MVAELSEDGLETIMVNKVLIIGIVFLCLWFESCHPVTVLVQFDLAPVLKKR